MLKFKEWHNYNCVENKVMDYIGDIYIKVFRKLPKGTGFKTDNGNMMFSTLMRLEDAAKMFGELSLIKVHLHMENDYRTLCALLGWEEVEVEANEKEVAQ